jgi:hypothetical protein
MLRSVRELENFRVASAEGTRCGLVKDVYFDDRTWAIQYLVLGLDPRQFGAKQVLAVPGQVLECNSEDAVLRLTLRASQIGDLPLASSMLPVCKQYASLAFATPASSARRPGAANPYLRSARAVNRYQVVAADEPAGALVDLLLDDSDWQVRHLRVEQTIEDRQVSFYVQPQSVERFSFAARRLILRDLLPVELDQAPNHIGAVAAA